MGKRSRMKYQGQRPARSETTVEAIDPRLFFQERKAGNDNPRLLSFESVLSAADGSPHVYMAWGGESGQITPQEAREHALHVLEVAEAAEYDAAYHHFLVRELNLDPETAIGMVGMMREHRGKTRGYHWKTHAESE